MTADISASSRPRTDGAENDHQQSDQGEVGLFRNWLRAALRGKPDNSWRETIEELIEDNGEAEAEAADHERILLGNILRLKDLTAYDIMVPRADIIACEDTRVTKKLLQLHGLDHGRLVSYHEHNAGKMGPNLIEHLNSGEIVALVSDAGTPMINDPGYRLTESCRAQGIGAAP